MEITWIIVGAVAIIYCYYWYRRPKGFPPGPRGIPALGVIPFFGKFPERKICKWSKTYGPIMSVRMGTEDQVSLNNYDLIMQALVKQSTAFSGRPHIPFIEQISQGHGLVFIDYGKRWKSQRKFGLMTLRGFGVGKRSMENKIIEEIGYLNDSILSENGKAFKVSVLLRQSASNIICSIVFGKRFEYDDSQFQDVIQKYFDLFSDSFTSVIIVLMTLVPWLVHIPPFSNINKGLLNDMNAMLDLFREIIKEHEDTFNNEELRDFIDSFIKEIKKKDDPNFTNMQLIQYVRDLFEAGTETTSTTLNWSLLCCLHYPQAQTKLREEIYRVIGANGTISMSHKNEMPYTNAFIQEIFRYRTLVPLSLMHKTNEDTEIGSYFIPKGTTILPNLWAVHNDPALFEESEKFQPERFLDEKGNFVPSKHVIPFSVGPRHCVGEQLAQMEVFLFLVGMIQKFEFLPDPADDKLPDINDGVSDITFSTVPYKLVANQI